MNILPWFRIVLFSFFVSVFTGCATSEYTTHYGLFEAESASGELRQFRVYWQTVRYQGWKKNEYRALPVFLETQCSERALLFYDDSFGKGLRCNDMKEPGISYCGRNRLDTDRRGLNITENQTCGYITDKQGSTNILSLDGELMLTISCRPRVIERLEDGKKISTDYLLSSEVPYVFSTKSVPGSNIEALVPPLFNHSSVCEQD